MIARVVTQPAVEPVTLAEAKAHLRIEDTVDDAYISALIRAARENAEQHCWRGFVTQTWEAVTESFPDGGVVTLPGGAISSVASVKYLDANGAEQSFAADSYVFDGYSEPGRLLLGYGKSWPGIRSQWDAVRIRYVVGVAAADVPASIKQAILLLVSQMYEHRTPDVLGAPVAKLSFAVDSLLAPYRLNRF